MEGSRSRIRVMEDLEIYLAGKRNRAAPKASAHPPCSRALPAPDRLGRTARRKSCSARRTPRRSTCRRRRAAALEGQASGEGGAGTGT